MQELGVNLSNWHQWLDTRDITPDPFTVVLAYRDVNACISLPDGTQRRERRVNEPSQALVMAQAGQEVRTSLM